MKLCMKIILCCYLILMMSASALAKDISDTETRTDKELSLFKSSLSNKL